MLLYPRLWLLSLTVDPEKKILLPNGKYTTDVDNQLDPENKQLLLQHSGTMLRYTW